MRKRPEYDMKLIGSNLKRLRESKNISVEDVRKYLCLGSVQAVYKYEKGISYPPADTMFALMELYEADLEDIIGNHERRQCANSVDCGQLDVIFADVERHQQFLLDNENICRLKRITGERIGIVERKAANKYAREYNRLIKYYELYNEYFSKAAG